MARELTFVITAQTYEAEAKLRVLETQIQGLNKDLETGKITWEEYEKQLKSASSAAASQKQTVEELRKGQQAQTQQTSALTAALMRYASGAAIGAAIKNTAAWASHLEDLSARSGIGIVQLQKLGMAAEKSGGSLEQIATASTMLLDKLGSNDKALIKAVSTLGLNLAALRNQDPGQTFIELATAIAKVEDPAQRMALAVDLFGRQGRQLMPTILEIGRGLENIATVSPATTAKLDALDDILAGMWRTAKVLLADILVPFVPALTAIGTAAVWVGEKLSRLFTQFGAVPWLKQALGQLDLLVRSPTGPGAPTGPGLRTNPGMTGPVAGSNTFEAAFWLAGLQKSAKDLATEEKDAAKAARELAAAHRRLGQDAEGRIIAKNLGGASYAPTVGGWWGTGASPGLMGTGEIPSWLSGGDLPSRAITTGLWTGPSVSPSGVTGLGGGGLLSAFGGLKGFSGGLSGAVLGALQGGGKVGQSIGGFVGQGLGTWAGQAMSTAIGGSMGSALGAIMPGVGALLGPAIGWLQDKLFGGEAKRTKTARGQFIEEFGGLDELKKQADLAGFSLDKLLSTKKTKTLESEIRKLNAALQDMQKRVAAITDELATLDATGGLISQGLLDKITKDIKNPAVQHAVFQFMQAQANSALDALQNYVTRTQVLTTGGAQALAASVVAVFGELQREGASAIEALQKLQPTIAALSRQLDRMGLGGGDAFDTIRRLSAVASDEIRGPLLQGISDLTTAMTGLQNLGLLTQDIFSGFLEEITATYQKLIDLGTAPADALVLLQQPLQRIYELQQRFGLTVDETTQRLLDEATAAGLVGDQYKDASERMVDAINTLIGRFDILLEKVYGIVPAANAAAAAVGNIQRADDGSEYWTGKPVDRDAETPEFASGSGGLRDFGRETVARLHGTEAVVTEAQWRTLTQGRGPTVQIDARGALLGDPASQAALARLVSDAVMAQQTLRGAVN